MIVGNIGHQLESLFEGLTGIIDGEGVPVPLTSTRTHVAISKGLAIVTTSRTFNNAENVPIEAILTMPVGFDAVMTGLRARIGDRELVARAKANEMARQDYETAIDEGKMAVLHEEALRGVHVLSIGSLAPGSEVEVVLETVAPMTNSAGLPFLRIPTTVGQIYGTSPLLPVDDLVTSPNVIHLTKLDVDVDNGRPRLATENRLLTESIEVPLDRAIEIIVDDGTFGCRNGCAADGSAVSVELTPLRTTKRPIDVAILFDRSGSTGFSSYGERSVWSAMRTGLTEALNELTDEDTVALWQFDSECSKLGIERGKKAASLTEHLGGPRGGTELGEAVSQVLSTGAKQIIVLTDGQTYAHEVESLKGSEAQVSAIVVGHSSLDANIGHICASTGGQVLYSRGGDVFPGIKTALDSMRALGRPSEGDFEMDRLRSLRTARGGVDICINWSDEPTKEIAAPDSVGKFAAALAMPLLEKDKATDLAVRHGICTHSTSLVLVDEASTRVSEAPVTRKVSLMQPSERLSGARYCLSVEDAMHARISPTIDFCLSSESRVAYSASAESRTEPTIQAIKSSDSPSNTKKATRISRQLRSVRGLMPSLGGRRPAHPGQPIDN